LWFVGCSHGNWLFEGLYLGGDNDDFVDGGGADDGVVDFVHEFVGLIHEAVVFGGVGGDGGLDVEGGSLGKFGLGFGG
jgi:hypothetical protein